MLKSVSLLFTFLMWLLNILNCRCGSHCLHSGKSKDAEAVVPVMPLSNSAVCPAQARQTPESRHRPPQTRQVENPRAAILPGVISLPGPIHVVLGACYVACDLKMCPSPSLPEKRLRDRSLSCATDDRAHLQLRLNEL